MDPVVKLLTFAETRQQLGKTDQQARWMLRQKDWPKTAKIGGRLMTRQSDIDAYLAVKFGEQQVAS